MHTLYTAPDLYSIDEGCILLTRQHVSVPYHSGTCSSPSDPTQPFSVRQYSLLKAKRTVCSVLCKYAPAHTTPSVCTTLHCCVVCSVSVINN